MLAPSTQRTRFSLKIRPRNQPQEMFLLLRPQRFIIGRGLLLEALMERPRALGHITDLLRFRCRLKKMLRLKKIEHMRVDL